MRTSRWLLVIAAVTLLDVAQSVVVVALAESLAATPNAFAGVTLLTAFTVVLTPVFFAAVYFDAGVVRGSRSSWTPNRRLWVGGGVAVLALTYLLTNGFSLALVGIPYLIRRYRTGATAARDEQPVSSTSRERSALGVCVHPLALFTGVVGAGLVYVLSANPFTRENARHALNWHASLALLFATGWSLFLLAADQRRVFGYSIPGAVLPAPFDALVGLLGLFVLLVAVLGWAVTVALAVAATASAIRGTARRYPFSWEFVE